MKQTSLESTTDILFIPTRVDQLALKQRLTEANYNTSTRTHTHYTIKGSSYITCTYNCVSSMPILYVKGYDTDTYTLTHTLTHTHSHTRTHTHSHTHSHSHTYMHSHTHSHTHTHTLTLTHTHALTRTHTCTHSHTHIHSDIQTHTYRDGSMNDRPDLFYFKWRFMHCKETQLFIRCILIKTHHHHMLTYTMYMYTVNVALGVTQSTTSRDRCVF